jgi:hypothetical protein
MRFSSLLCGILLAGAVSALANDADSDSPEYAHSLWQQMARHDLEFIREQLLIHHPGAVDGDNPDFAVWLDAGHAEALGRIERVRGFAAYHHVLRGFVHGFADKHLALEMSLGYRRHAWSGIVMAWNGRDFVVRDRADDVALPVGAVLVGCDGIPVEDLWVARVETFYARKGIPADRFREAPRLLIANANPLVELPRECRFVENGRTLGLQLAWRDSEAEMLRQILSAARPIRRRAEQSQLRPFGERGAWLELASFSAQGDQSDRLHELLAGLETLRALETLVVDVRGNGGGSSHWTEVFVRRLYGDDFWRWTRQRWQTQKSAPRVDYRASNGNLEYFREAEPVILQQAGADSSFYRHFRDLVSGMAAAIDAGEDFYSSVPDAEEFSEEVPEAAPVPEFGGRVVLLTDSLCASACLDFADQVLALPGVVHVGHPTSADTQYMEVRSVPLPSSAGSLVFATKIYRGRYRPVNGYYSPEHLYLGDINDTEAVAAWIEGLLQGR